MVLNREGLSVEVARDGEEVVERAKAKPFDIIITDISMPKKEGIEVIMEVKALHPSIKVIAISGGGRKGKMDFLRMAKMVGATAILAKPFGPRELLAEVNKCLTS